MFSAVKKPVRGTSAMIIVTIISILIVLIIYIFMQQPPFGKAAAGERLQTILNSPNFKNGQFQNVSNTPALTEGASYFGIMRKFFFQKSKRGTTTDKLPTRKTNLLDLDPSKHLLVWFGHSSYFMQLDGRKILVDPVLSGNASPVSFTTKSFNGSDVYTTDEIPEIDYLFITHDHWDHLDYKTVVKLKPKIKKVITGLGVGAHLERWGFDKNIITEKDWNEEWVPEDGFKIHTAPARHFSGRGFKRNRSLWMSYILTTPSMKIFIGGDSGYDEHFKMIGNQFGPFDLVILENGQYNENWKYIHMMPEEVVQAAKDLKATLLLPVHWSKFSLSIHAWDEPMIRLMKEAEKQHQPVLHPMIGEAVDLQENVTSIEWWKGIN
jgi:L-ascorbate metabolism protein UlaG (beta-lactamase superfamily)